MLNMRGMKFTDCLDIVQLISKPAREHLGEDCFYCKESRLSAIVSVCDGCGGLGAHKYESFQGHTGAYIASRAVSGAIRDWYHDYSKKNWGNTGKLAAAIDRYICKAYEVCEPYGIERLKIRGSMVRKFPTTLALAYAEHDGNGILVHILWAGDSRVYLLDEKGLAQLTIDDTDVTDALENLMSDGALNNVLSSDGNYQIHYRNIHLSRPAIIFAATDGCFGYIPSPMEFEYVILDTLINSKNPDQFKKLLCKKLASFAGDDLALGLMSFYFGNFNNTKQFFVRRVQYLEKTYLDVLNEETNDDVIRRLWSRYKPAYERYIRQG